MTDSPPINYQVTQVLDDLRPRYQRAFVGIADEDVRWDIYLMPMPTERVDQHGNREIICMLVLYAELKGAIIGVPISGNQVSPVAGAQNDEDITKRVEQMYTALVAGRRDQIAQMHLDAQANNGQQTLAGRIDLAAGPNRMTDNGRNALQDFLRGE